MKRGEFGRDLHDKIIYAQAEWRGLGMTDDQILWTLALVDHESAGTWSPTVLGDNGCSKGIGQWNSCPGSGRHAAETFELQVAQIGTEMLAKYQLFSIRTAVGKHNAPAWDSNTGYTARVEAATLNFY